MAAITQAARLAVEELRYRMLALQHTVRAGSSGPARRKILVNGSPKTGTTWMLRMLDSLPGYRLAGHAGRKDRKIASARPGDILHAHLPYSPALEARLARAGFRLVLMLRDPRDQTVSRMYHIRRQESHPWHSRFREMNDPEALMACIEGRDARDLPDARTMIALAESWQACEAPLCTVRYEDLLHDPPGQLRRVFDSLEIPVSAGLLACIVQRNRFERLTIGRNIFRRPRPQGEADPGSHFRKGIAGDWRNHFSAQHIARFKELAGQSLIDWGYETGWDW